MSFDMNDLKLTPEDVAPYRTRACNTCLHRPDDLGSPIARCRATNEYVDWERGGEWGYSGTCGPAGKLWELAPPAPEPEPWIGLIPWLRWFFFGTKP